MCRIGKPGCVSGLCYRSSPNYHNRSVHSTTPHQVFPHGCLSLLDGSIGFPVERLYREICDRLEIGRGDSDEIKQKVNDLYWKHHNAALPSQDGGTARDPVRAATQKTVYDAGALEALAGRANSCSPRPSPKMRRPSKKSRLKWPSSLNWLKRTCSLKGASTPL